MFWSFGHYLISRLGVYLQNLKEMFLCRILLLLRLLISQGEFSGCVPLHATVAMMCEIVCKLFILVSKFHLIQFCCDEN